MRRQTENSVNSHIKYKRSKHANPKAEIVILGKKRKTQLYAAYEKLTLNKYEDTNTLKEKVLACYCVVMEVLVQILRPHMLF